MKKIILLLALCFTANNFFAQTTDPNQLKNEGNDALNAKIMLLLMRNIANT